MREKIHKIIRKKRTWAGAVILIGIGIAIFTQGPWATKAEAVSFVLTTVKKGDLSTTVSGSGQVSVLKSVNVTPETSGKIISVKVKNGDNVKAGQVLAIIDQRDASLDLARARASLLSAQANYDDVAAGVAGDDLKLYKLSLESTQASYDSAVDDLETAKTDAEEAIKQAEDDLADLLDESPASNNDRADLITTLEAKILLAHTSLDSLERLIKNDDAKNSLAVFNSSYLLKADNDCGQARDYLADARDSVAAAKILRSNDRLESAVNTVLKVLNKTSDAADNLFFALDNSYPSNDFSQSSIDSNKNSMSSLVTTMSTAITAVQTSWQSFLESIEEAREDLEDTKLSAETSIDSAQTKVDSTWRSLETAKVQYSKNIAPATAEEIASARSSLLSAQALVRSAADAYNNTVIKAPIAGKLDGFELVVGDQVSQSSIGTIMTDQKIAVIPFNEVDTAKIKVGQSATLTFDALEDVSIKGKVIEVASTGNVSQGIVNYDVKISLDEDDERIKTEMSVSATITVETKTGILLVPSEAVKSQGDVYYVEVPSDSLDQNDPKAPYSGNVGRKMVSTGITDDTFIEITNGLEEGESIVGRTITAVKNTAASTSNSSSRTSGSNANVMRMSGQFTGGFSR